VHDAEQAATISAEVAEKEAIEAQKVADAIAAAEVSSHPITFSRCLTTVLVWSRF
jgi:hypothetical protein